MLSDSFCATIPLRRVSPNYERYALADEFLQGNRLEGCALGGGNRCDKLFISQMRGALTAMRLEVI